MNSTDMMYTYEITIKNAIKYGEQLMQARTINFKGRVYAEYLNDAKAKVIDYINDIYYFEERDILYFNIWDAVEIVKFTIDEETVINY